MNDVKQNNAQKIPGMSANVKVPANTVKQKKETDEIEDMLAGL